MSSMLEKLQIATHCISVTEKPFESWEDSPVKEWDITMQMLSIGDLVDIAKLSSTASHLETAYISKVYLLAKCIKSINGHQVVTDEDLDDYNKEHNFIGNQRISTFDYKVLHIKKWSEPVVNRLAYMYDEMQDEYLVSHLGSTVEQGVRDAVISGIDLSQVSVSPEAEAKEESNAGGEPPIST